MSPAGGRLGLPGRCASPAVGDAGLHRAGSGVGVDDRLELALPDGLLASAPVVVEVAQVQVHRLPVVGDEPVGPRQVVEVLVSELPLRRRFRAAPPYARVGRVEQGQRPNAVGRPKRKRLDDRRPDVVAGQDHPGNLQAIQQGPAGPRPARRARTPRPAAGRACRSRRTRGSPGRLRRRPRPGAAARGASRTRSPASRAAAAAGRRDRGGRSAAAPRPTRPPARVPRRGRREAVQHVGVGHRRAPVGGGWDRPAMPDTVGA
jgi:hypothetical protein